MGKNKVKLKQNKAITLIALVITIVVLIILAGVSVSVILGENGIITKAQEAKTKTQETTFNEQTAINETVEYMNGLEKFIAGIEIKKPDNWTSTQITPIDNGKGNAIPLPNGFYYVGGDIEEGIVISDNVNDKDKGTAYETKLTGNQFVWIPVKSEQDLTRTVFDINGKETSGLDIDFTEPYTNGYATEIQEFNTMKTQVLKYGGFYIGRYEAGDGSNPAARTGPTIARKVVIKKGIIPYNWVPWGKAINDASEISGQSGAVYLSKKMYETSNSVVSTLCYGSQWDAMCKYIGDNNRTTPTKSAPELTGSVKTDMSKNIYDLAGNCSEWTMEANYIFNRDSRGGNYFESHKINQRIVVIPDYTRRNDGFRPTLYIK